MINTSYGFGNNNRQDDDATRFSVVRDTEIKDHLVGTAMSDQTTPCIVRPLYTKANSVFRILPGVDPQGDILTQNVNVDEYDIKNPGHNLSDTFFSTRVIEGFGVGAQMSSRVIADYLVGGPDYEEDISRERPLGTPLCHFYSVLDASQRSTSRFPNHLRRSPLPEWRSWIMTGFGRGQTGMCYPRPTLMFQALINVVNDKPFVNAQNQAVWRYGLLLVTGGNSISQILWDLTAPCNNRQDLDPHTNSNLGPVAEQDGIVTFANSTTEPKTGKNMLSFAPIPPGADIRTTPVTPWPLDPAFIQRLWLPWSHLLRFYTRDEQFRLIAENYGADTVNHIFCDTDFEMYIPADIRQQGFGRYEGAGSGYTANAAPSYAAPGAPAMPGMPGAPALPGAPAMPQAQRPGAAQPPTGAPAMPGMPQGGSYQAQPYQRQPSAPAQRPMPGAPSMPQAPQAQPRPAAAPAQRNVPGVPPVPQMPAAPQQAPQQQQYAPETQAMLASIQNAQVQYSPVGASDGIPMGNRADSNAARQQAAAPPMPAAPTMGIPSLADLPEINE